MQRPQTTESDNSGYVASPFPPQVSGQKRRGGGGPTPLTAAQRVARFWSKVQKSDGCWLWTGGTFKNGYGMFNVGRGPNGEHNTRYAHRVAFQLANGPIADGLYICHTCDTPRCVNPRHLFLGTQLDNIRDCVAKGRARKARGPRTYPAHVLTEALMLPRTHGALIACARRNNVPYHTLAIAVWRARHRRTVLTPEQRLAFIEVETAHANYTRAMQR